MKNVAQFPGYNDGSWGHWSERTVVDVDRFLTGLTFTPSRACLLLQSNYYPAAKILGLEVPTLRLERGEIAIEPGCIASYEWGSVDGRSTDYLSLDLDFDPGVLRSFVERLKQIMKIDRRSDLTIFVHSTAQ